MSVKSTRTRHLAAKRLAKVHDGLLAASVLNDYKPSREEFGSGQLIKMRNYLQAKHKEEEVARHIYEAAKDAAIKAEWDASDFLIEVSNQVRAQYGDNSDQYASLGYKKKTAYKKASGKKD